MANKPTVKLGDWITFGNGLFSKNAVVSNIYDDSSIADIEVVYFDDRGRPINENMIWKDDIWQFCVSGPSGGYADKYDRLKEYVQKLKRNF